MLDPATGSRPASSTPDSRRGSVERRILEGARALIDAGVSWHALGIRQIAEQAEISRTAFYDFFGSKNEVLEHLIRSMHEDLTVNLRDSLDLATIGRFDLALMRPTLMAVAAYAAEHGYVYRAFLQATTEDEGLHELWSELVDAYTALIGASIEGARAHDPAVPNTANAQAVGRALLLMTERCLIAELGRTDSTRTVDALVDVWERTVFGTTSTPPT